MSLYLQINLFSIIVPFLVSFHPKIKLHLRWKALFPAILLAAVPYLIWDVIFTKNGYWGFNPIYLQGIYIFELPIEEWLFFICIPYASIFTHLVISENTKFQLSDKAVNWISYFLFAFFIIMAVSFFNKSYTFWDAIFSFCILLGAFFLQRKILNTFFITFLVVLIPFIIVNGILTGTGIDGEVVWYNNTQNLGIRFFTIPVEDFFYAFSMLLLGLTLFQFFTSKIKAK